IWRWDSPAILRVAHASAPVIAARPRVPIATRAFHPSHAQKEPATSDRTARQYAQAKRDAFRRLVDEPSARPPPGRPGCERAGERATAANDGGAGRGGRADA